MRLRDGFLLVNVTPLLNDFLSSYGRPDKQSIISFTVPRFAQHGQLNNSTPLAVIHNLPKAVYLNSNMHPVRDMRARRSVLSRYPSHDASTYTERCTLAPWTLRFQDIGWDDWVFQPKAYQANTCLGVCAIDDWDDTGVIQVNMSAHAFLRGMFRNRTSDSQLLLTLNPPTCVPTTMSPINLLLHDEEGNINLRRQSEMIVDSCGCY